VLSVIKKTRRRALGGGGIAGDHSAVFAPPSDSIPAAVLLGYARDRSGDPSTGEFQDAVILAQFGEVDLNALSQ
jgi:hypothetical protein